MVFQTHPPAGMVRKGENMSKYTYQEAADKLDKECKAGSFGSKEKAMKSSIVTALKDFCTQSERMREKVVEGRSFEECMKAVAKNVGTSISDLEAYKRAVKYYWPEADVRFQMEIYAEGGGRAEASPAKSAAAVSQRGEILDLSSFL